MTQHIARVLQERPRLYAAVRLGVVVVALVVLLNFVVPDLVAAIPFPDLPDLRDFPDMPDWARWVKLAIVIGIIALVLIGEAEKDREPDEPDD